jgi:hypothetical protein
VSQAVQDPPTRPPRTSRTTPPTSTGRTNLENMSTARDAATSTTSRSSNETEAAASLVALQLESTRTENAEAGLMETLQPSPAQPLTDLTSPASEVIDIDEMMFEDVPGANTRPQRSIRPTPKAARWAEASPNMGQPGGSKEQPQPVRKARLPDNTAAVNAMIRKQHEKERQERFTAEAELITQAAVRQRQPAVSQRPAPLPQVRAFDYCLTASFFLDKEKDPIQAKLIKELFSFQFDPWVTSAMEVLLERLLRSPFTVRPRPAIVTFHSNQKLFKSSALTVDNESGWNDVKDMLSRWKENGCWSVNVDLKLTFEKVEKAEEDVFPSHETIRIDSSDEHGFVPARKAAAAVKESEESKAQAKVSKKATVTRGRLQDEEMYRQADAATKSYIKDILEANDCPKDKCSKDPLPCVNCNGTHVIVTQEELVRWSEEIGRRTATARFPHPGLRRNLEIRAEALREKASKKKKKPRRDSDDSNPSKSSSGGHTRKRSRNGTRKQTENEMGPLLPILLASFLSNQSRGTQIPSIQLPPEALSSPPRVPRGTRETLHDYLTYLKKKEPSKAAQITAAEEVLDKNDVDLGNLPSVSTADLLSIGLTLGIAKLLPTRIKQFMRRQARRERDSSDDAEDNTDDG